MKEKIRKTKVVVIGGGIHGITAAIALCDNNLEVTLIEKNDGLLKGTSGATHNRAHLGYHYPKSIITAKECVKGLKLFKKKYPEALFYPKSSYYLIDKNQSKVSSEQFKEFCNKLRIPYKITEKSKGYWNEKMIDKGFKVNEPVFDVAKLRKIIENEGKKKGLNILTDSELISAKRDKDKYILELKINNNTEKISADIIINATYAYSNNILKILGLEKEATEYEMQYTEVALIESKKELPALTVMDGDFVSIMPLANKEKDRLYLIYDVLYSVIKKEKNNFVDDTQKFKSNYKKMLEHGIKYFPFMKDFEYKKSYFGYRPIPKNTKNACRKTRIIKHTKKPVVYSILEGKFISAPLVAKQLIRKMKKDKLI